MEPGDILGFYAGHVVFRRDAAKRFGADAAANAWKIDMVDGTPTLLLVGVEQCQLGAIQCPSAKQKANVTSTALLWLGVPRIIYIAAASIKPGDLLIVSEEDEDEVEVDMESSDETLVSSTTPVKRPLPPATDQPPAKRARTDSEEAMETIVTTAPTRLRRLLPLDVGFESPPPSKMEPVLRGLGLDDATVSLLLRLGATDPKLIQFLPGTPQFDALPVVHRRAVLSLKPK